MKHRSILSTILVLCLSGCSYVNTIGDVGSLRFHKVQLGSFIGPSQTVIVVEETNTHKVEIMTPMAGNGIVPAVVQAAGIGIAARQLGKAMREKTTVNIHDDSPSPPIDPPNEPPGPPIPPPVTPPPPVVVNPQHPVHPPPWTAPGWSKNKPKHKWD